MKKHTLALMKKAFVALALSSVSCVDRLETVPEFSSVDSNQIVVDGFISDQPGPYFVRIFKPSSIVDVLEFREDVNAKQVTIFDDQGNEEVLDGERGFYFSSPNGIRGVVGRKYNLRIELFDGRVFTSVPDELQPPGTIDSIMVKFETNKPLSGPTEYSYRVSINSTTPANSFFRWKYTGVFFIQTLQGGCWSRIFEERPNVSDGEFVQDGQFKSVEVGIVPVNETTFFKKFMIQIDQMSLNQASFTFWKTARDQFDARQSLFQPGIGALPSNIFEEVTKEPAMGLFYATAITTKQIFLTKNDVPVLIPPFTAQIEAPCVNVFRNATEIKPPGWVD